MSKLFNFFFNPAGSLSRSEYAFSALIVTALALVVATFAYFAMLPAELVFIYQAVVSLAFHALFCAFLATTARRLRDTGGNPYLSLVIGTYLLLCFYFSLVFGGVALLLTLLVLIWLPTDRYLRLAEDVEKASE